MNMFKKALYLIFAAFFVVSCGDGDDEVIQGPENAGETNEAQLDPAAINRIIESLPPPIETAATIEDMDVPYSKNYLVPSEKADGFDTNFKKAVGLGFYSADLGYLNVYNRTNSIVEYLTVIKRISDDLDVDQFFDFQTLKRLATNSEDLTELMFLSVNSYHKMDDHLRSTKRSDLSALMVTGVWLEGMYLSAKVSKLKKNDKIKDRVGEQKEILGDMLYVLNFFEKKPYFPDLIKDFETLKEAYQDVVITTEQVESKEEVIDGIVVITPNELTSIHMTDEQFKEISDLIIKIRNKLISA
ncbi:MAG: hypothetical protein U9N85_07995 [Bacteroidota bacterium]|nr:hypothetical protein [Bacteroidota bacterium]